MSSITAIGAGTASPTPSSFSAKPSAAPPSASPPRPAQPHVASGETQPKAAVVDGTVKTKASSDPQGPPKATSTTSASAPSTHDKSARLLDVKA